MENLNQNQANVQNQIPLDSPQQATIHTGNNANSLSRVILVGIILFVALAVSLGIIFFMNKNNQSASADIRRNERNSEPINRLRATSTPTIIPTPIESEEMQKEIDEINVESIDSEMTSIDADLNQL